MLIAINTWVHLSRIDCNETVNARGLSFFPPFFSYPSLKKSLAGLIIEIIVCKHIIVVFKGRMS